MKLKSTIKNDTFICDCCKCEYIDSGEHITHNDKQICNYCNDAEYFSCNVCRELYHNSTLMIIGDDYLCPDCGELELKY